MRFIVDEIEPTECPFYSYGRCHCGKYSDDCDYDYRKNPYECEFCISIKKIKDGDPD